MTLDHGKDGRVAVDMTSYVKEVLSKFPEKLRIEGTTATTNNLFTVKNDKWLSKYQAVNYNHSVM